MNVPYSNAVKLSRTEAQKMALSINLESLTSIRLEFNCYFFAKMERNERQYYIRGQRSDVEKLINRLKEGLKVLPSVKASENRRNRLSEIIKRGERLAEEVLENRLDDRFA
ncbi:MAG: hypothetical protein KW788_00210 [Candidatus Doudnabacteria bacterium]|nr:hypothetical protein [Candidatus Doudnabacteria bacterium]